MIAYITGASSGIGQAIALKLLENGHQVIGMSRRCTIRHVNYDHVSIDLSDVAQITKFEFVSNTVDDVILINNAGIIGPIKPIGSHVDQEIIDINTINLIAPQVLTNKFINKFVHFNQSYQVINISSGAGKSPIDAWSTYCGTKAAIDLFSESIFLELHDRKYYNWQVFSIAPGVVDTEMQLQIRQANPSQFLAHQKFVDLSANNELSDVKIVASLLYKIIRKPNRFNKVVFSLRDVV